MCEIQDRIKKIINKNVPLVQSTGWNKFNPAVFENPELDIKERKNLQYNDTANFYKYVEYTKWDEGETCVAIGFNPAKHEVNEIDNTNKQLITVLKNKYGSYVLINLFPQVSANKRQFKKNDKEDEAFKATLLKILDLCLEQKKDTVIFWGRTVTIDKDILEKLMKLQECGKLYKTVKEGTSSHYHPARCNIKTEKVSNNDFVGGYKLT